MQPQQSLDSLQQSTSPDGSGNTGFPSLSMSTQSLGPFLSDNHLMQLQPTEQQMRCVEYLGRCQSLRLALSPFLSTVKDKALGKQCGQSLREGACPRSRPVSMAPFLSGSLRYLNQILLLQPQDPQPNGDQDTAPAMNETIVDVV
jgi:hypothetical protein